MTVTLDFPPNIEAHIQVAAEKHSLKVEDYLLQLVATGVDHDELMPNEDQSASVERALSNYRTKLRPLLEPEHTGDNVAIHPDSEDYEVARGMGHAIRALRVRQTEGPIAVHKIGIADEGLRRRMRGERLR